ncbi:hypothetical protein [Aquibacillus albus]|uniref:Transcriptional regulator YdeE n=1 Tax=Aquibacillus albus TaxID=1168171 RepID=A0ABS2N428_9BACI|nr:hypothetical protein [Aquibacillus albus]MBM7572900.1 putative transcriptional regulator YdeE [Aquibacillus albus]
MSIQVVHKETLHIIGLSIDVLLKDAQGTELIPNLHRRFNQRLKDLKNVVNPN